MKNVALAILLLPALSFADGIKNDREFDKYLADYAKRSAKYQICGEYDTADVANVGIYFDEILSPSYLKQQIKKYGTQDKAANAAMNKVQKLSTMHQHRMVDKGVPMGMCQKLLQE